MNLSSLLSKTTRTVTAVASVTANGYIKQGGGHSGRTSKASKNVGLPISPYSTALIEWNDK